MCDSTNVSYGFVYMYVRYEHLVLILYINTAVLLREDCYTGKLDQSIKRSANRKRASLLSRDIKCLHKSSAVISTRNGQILILNKGRPISLQNSQLRNGAPYRSIFNFLFSYRFG